MAVRLLHAFRSPKRDGSDATLVQPSHWNDEHLVEMDGPALFGRTNGSGVAEEIPLSPNMAFVDGALATTLESNFASESGAGMVGYLLGLPASVARLLQNRLAEEVSIEDFRDEGDYTAAGDLMAWDRAMASGARKIRLPRAAYALTNAIVPVGTTVRRIRGDNTTITVTAATDAVGIQVNKQQFLEIDGLSMVSSGTKADGLNVTGIKWAASASYQRVRNCKFTNFSGSGLDVTQCVQFLFDEIESTSCGRTFLFSPSGGYPCSAVRIRGGYLSGSTDGIYSLNGLTDYVIDGATLEYCGDASDTAKAAVNITGGLGSERNCYFESNEKNRHYEDTLCQISHPNEYAATSYTDTLSWSGVPFNQRGYSRITNNSLEISRLIGDTSNGSGIEVVGNLGIGTFPTAGMIAHYKAGEVRVRFEPSNVGGKTMEFMFGGGGALPVGYTALYDVTNGTNRILVGVGTTEGLRIDGSGTSTELWLNGTRLLKTPRTGWAADTGTAKRTANATYSGTASAGYVQAEMTAVMNALRDATQAIKALKDDLLDHGQITA